MALKTKTKRLTRKELELRLAQYEKATVDDQASQVKQEVTAQERKVVWTEEMVRSLLELRLNRYAAAFQATRSNQQLSVLWEKIALSLNIACSTSVPALSAKTKSKYWEHLVEFLGDKNGLGHNEFGASIDLDEAIDVTSAEVPQKMRKVDEKAAKKERRGATNTVADGLAALGQTLAKGLVDAAQAAPVQQDNKIDAILEALQDSKKVQDALLQSRLDRSQ
ncbi:hypothetical protein AeMF1_018732 [Aphanomyces euteiches]|nr:hypothetical protein AeMF1_018732 [Aphanomyces euteiches]KAH9186752.1 hypothetical protein AeNC1_011270 [Aphanomyces euteiches]